MMQGGVIPTNKVVKKQRKQIEDYKKYVRNTQNDDKHFLDMNDVLQILSSSTPTPTPTPKDKSILDVKKTEMTKNNTKSTTNLRSSVRSKKQPMNTVEQSKTTSNSNRVKINNILANTLITQIKQSIIDEYSKDLVPYFKQQLLKYHCFVDSSITQINIINFAKMKYHELIAGIIRKHIKAMVKDVGEVKDMLKEDNTLLQYSSFSIDSPEKRNIDALKDDLIKKLITNHRRNKQMGVSQKVYTEQHKEQDMSVNALLKDIQNMM